LKNIHDNWNIKYKTNSQFKKISIYNKVNNKIPNKRNSCNTNNTNNNLSLKEKHLLLRSNGIFKKINIFKDKEIDLFFDLINYDNFNIKKLNC
jgi:hypothetical protein